MCHPTPSLATQLKFVVGTVFFFGITNLFFSTHLFSCLQLNLVQTKCNWVICCSLQKELSKINLLLDPNIDNKNGWFQKLFIYCGCCCCWPIGKMLGGQHQFVCCHPLIYITMLFSYYYFFFAHGNPTTVELW